MRFAAITVVPLLILGAVVPAFAQGKAKGKGKAETVSAVGGTYAVQFDEVQNSCKQTGISLKKNDVVVEAAGERGVAVSVPGVPLMKGKSGKEGKFQAKAARGKTAIEGLEGSFSVAGHIGAGKEGAVKVELLLIAEYYAGGKPLCTQSWNASGSRK